MNIRANNRAFAWATRLSQGFSLVELMIAMTLSLVLLGGALSIFAGTRKTYESIDQLSRIQENGRFALDQIVHDLRSAGYVGCSKAPRYSNNNLRDPATVLWNFAVPVQAFQGSGTTTWSPTLPSDVPTAAIAGSAFTTNDVLVVRVPRRGATPTRLTADMSNGTSDITITDATPSPVAVNDVVMVSDCEGQAFLEVTGYSAAAGVGTIAHAVTAATTTSPGNLSDSTRYPFPADAEVTPMETHVYFMANSTAGTSTALWRKIGKNNAEELVEGVDGMRLLFGIDSSNDQQADSYVRASGVSNWNNVVSVRVALLVRSLEQYGNAVNTKTYELLDTTTTSFGDRRQRQIFSSTVTLRNRAL